MAAAVGSRNGLAELDSVGISPLQRKCEPPVSDEEVSNFEQFDIREKQYCSSQLQRDTGQSWVSAG